MVNSNLARAGELRQALTDFVLDAEGELATALESYSAEQLTRSQQQDMNRRNFVIDRFLVEGRIGDQTPLDFFLESEPDLTEADRQLIENWRHGFIGLFAITQILPDGFELMNWTTAKHYTVKFTNQREQEASSRLKADEILLTQIAPATADEWIFSSAWTSLGKLGKPKLAVALGNFKQNYKNYLYSDAPELLEESWKSVERYHQDFVDFFGEAEVTLSGYELSKKLADFQELITQKRLEESGIDPSKSLAELAEESGVSQEEIEETAEAMGADTSTVSKLFEQKGKAKMVTPKVELPAQLKKAEQVTVLTHPRWGQMFLPNYSSIKAILEAEDWKSIPNAEAIVRKSLNEPEMNAFVWQTLAQQYPIQLQAVLQAVLERPDFQLETELSDLLKEFNKPTEPELPEIASVPIHLHNLFQEAIGELNRDKNKGKAKKKTGTGFQR